MTRAEPSETLSGSLFRENDDAIISKARSLRPLLLAHAQQHEDLGEISPEVMAALTDGGFLRLTIPRRWGGLSLSGIGTSRVYVELAKSCPATAWVLANMNAAAMEICLLPEAGQRELFSNGIPLAAGGGSPTGQARTVEGGYIVSGTWAYVSGSHHARWLLARVTEPDGREGPGGFIFAPATDFTIERNWNSVGLRGSGSETIAAKDMFVPQRRTILGPEVPPKYPGELADITPIAPLSRCLGTSVMIGIVEGLLEIAIGDNSSRPIALTKFKRKVDSSVFCASVGEAASQIFAAKALVESMMREIDRILVERRQLDYTSRAAFRGLVAISARMLRTAADHLMDMLGSSGFSMTAPGQRYWRDYCTVARHVSYMPDVGMEVYGRQLLGFPIEENVVAPAAI